MQESIAEYKFDFRAVVLIAEVVFLFLLLISSAASAATFAEYDLASITSTTNLTSMSFTKNVAPGVTANPLILGIGLEADATTQYDPGAFCGRHWSTESAPTLGTDYWELSVEAQPGYSIDYTSITFALATEEYASYLGPDTFDLYFSTDGGGTETKLATYDLSAKGDLERVKVTQSLTTIGTQTGKVIFRWYGYNLFNITYGVACLAGTNTNGLFSGTGSNIIFDGTVSSPATAPTVSTTAASSIAVTSATLGGNASADGGATITERGVVYSISDTTPTIGEPGVAQDTNGSGTGSFSKTIGALTVGTTYYFQAYAINSVGTSYGGVLSFTTLNNAPTIALNNVTLAYTENAAATPIDSTGTVSDSDGDADWNGGTLVVQITANNEAADELSIPDNVVGTINTSGTNLLNGATVIGTLSASEGTVTNGTALTLTFNSNATNTLVQQTLRAVHYRNTSDTPGTLNRTVTVTATDKHAAAANDARTVAVTAVNDDPALTGLVTDITVTEDVASNVDLSAATLTDVDAGTGNIVLTITAGAGTLSASSGGSVTIGGSGSGTLSLTGTVANIDTYLNTASNISYTGVLNVNGNNATTLTLTANDGGNTGSGGGADVSLGTVNVDISSVNDPPVITSAATVNAAENQTAVLTVTSTDVDAGATVSYSLTGGADQTKFSITAGGVLTFQAAPDFETKLDVGADNVYDVQVNADDGQGGTVAQNIAVTVTNVNEAPVITSAATVNAAENQTAVLTVTSTDVDAGATVSYSLTGGADQTKFSITAGGVLTFQAAPDFETKLDVGADNVYDVQVTADDGLGGTAPQNIAVTVTNVNEVPTVNPGQSFSVDENSVVSTSIGTVLGSDADVPTTLQSWTISSNVNPDGDGNVAFAIDAASGALTVNDTGDLDRETNASLTIQVTVSDGTYTSSAQDVTINLNDLNDNLPVATADAYDFYPGQVRVVSAPGVLGNDSDADSDAALTAVLVAAPAHAASFTLGADGSFSYTHDGTLSGNDSFTYKADDGLNQTAVTTVTLNLYTLSEKDAEIAVIPSNHLFGVETLGDCVSSTPVTFTVGNSGSDSRTLGSLSFGGNDAAEYAFGTDNCSGITLAGSDSCTVQVKFCPTAVGSKSATLLIPSDDAETPVLSALLYNHESLAEEAGRRLPPVLYALTIPETLPAGSPIVLTWSLLGYHDSFLSNIAFFNCSGSSAGSCGESYGSRFEASGYLSPVSSSAGSWNYNGEPSTIYNYSYTFTPPAVASSTDMVIRFYRKSTADAAAGKGGLSLLIPGNLTTTYYDNQGRRILKQITP